MCGPYVARKNKQIRYVGNKIFRPIKDMKKFKMRKYDIENRVEHFIKKKHIWKALQNINHTIYVSTVRFFDKLEAKFVLLPLTTRMISSPGAIYGKYKLDYTSDTTPIRLKWFNLKRDVFLSESSQIYLELALLQEGINHVFCIYNSFRKEKADITHLSEFHHIEYEGKISQIENEKICEKLTKFLIRNLLDKNEKDLKIFLEADDISNLEFFSRKRFKKITLKEALDILYSETSNKIYKKFSCQHFGAWEEIFITNYYDNFVIIKEYPMLEVPFYHAPIYDKKVIDESTGREIMVVDNADFIFPGYREYIGAGHRVRNIKELKWKAKIFNLPKKDYIPYLNSRNSKYYKETSGFGLGWERFLQGILKMPSIVDVSHFPRVHFTIMP